MLGLKLFLILAPQKAWLGIFFFQTFYGRMEAGGREEGAWQQVSPSIIWEAVEGSAGPQRFLCETFSRTRLPGNAATGLQRVGDLSGAVLCP